MANGNTVCVVMNQWDESFSCMREKYMRLEHHKYSALSPDHPVADHLFREMSGIKIFLVICLAAIFFLETVSAQVRCWWFLAPSGVAMSVRPSVILLKSCLRHSIFKSSSCTHSAIAIVTFSQPLKYLVLFILTIWSETLFPVRAAAVTPSAPDYPVGQESAWPGQILGVESEVSQFRKKDCTGVDRDMSWIDAYYISEVLNGRGANCRLQAGRCIQCRNNRDCSRGVCRARVCI